MNYYLGIDLGTTGVKAAIVDSNAKIITTAYRRYSISIPQIGYAEQDPEIWWSCTCEVIKEAVVVSKVNAGDIKGVGFSGQMHGCVMLDENYNVLYPSIIHCDQRAFEEKQEMIEKVGFENLGRWAQNQPHSGFQVLSLMWTRKNRQDIFSKIKYVLLPKDYLRLKLTGEAATEVTDACSTLMFDNQKQNWSEDIISCLDIPKSILPKADNRPQEVAGYVTAEAAEKTGLLKGTLVSYGAGDQVAQAVGNNIVKEGIASITLGTSGQIFIPTSKLCYEKDLKLNVFTHAPKDTWYMLGAVLNACLASDWFANKALGGVDYKEMHKIASMAKPGCEGLIFMPYLTGERVPLMDEKARAGFIGLTLAHSRNEMARAVLEGISYSLYDAMNVILSLGVDVDRFLLSGGGTKSPLWQHILADVFNRPMCISNISEQAALGAAKLAMVAAGEYTSIEEVCDALPIQVDNIIVPNNENHMIYKECYERFTACYKNNKDYFSNL